MSQERTQAMNDLRRMSPILSPAALSALTLPEILRLRDHLVAAMVAEPHAPTPHVEPLTALAKINPREST